ncbi:MAG: hypothetical protein WDO24_21260 [Pseudomonadota bacterium]
MWRPQREAQILRRLAARHSGKFPRAAIVRIWREIMSAMLGLEGRVSVAVCVAPVPAGDQTADRPGFWDLAHDHFGATVPITSFQAPGAVMRAVTDDPNMVGVLPWPRDEDPDPWWRHLLGAEAPRIVARLPFGDGEPALSALAVARAARRVERRRPVVSRHRDQRGDQPDAIVVVPGGGRLRRRFHRHRSRAAGAAGQPASGRDRRLRRPDRQEVDGNPRCRARCDPPRGLARQLCGVARRPRRGQAAGQCGSRYDSRQRRQAVAGAATRPTAKPSVKT